jgi:hypothetical protein
MFVIGSGYSSEAANLNPATLGSCRCHWIKPFEYLNDLFTPLPEAKITQIKVVHPGGVGRSQSDGEIGRSVSNE